MEKIIIIAFTLVFLSCEKEQDQFPVKFQSTAFSNGYKIKSQTNPVNLITDFIALPSLAQGSDNDVYEVKLYADKDLKKLLFTYISTVKPNDSRNVISNYRIYNYYVLNNNIVYYRVVRIEDNKYSEVRSVDFNWK